MGSEMCIRDSFGTVSCEEDNWQPKIKKLEKSLNLWRSRSISLLGKALIINTLGLSKLVYLAKVLILPDWVLTRVNALIWPFIWGCCDVSPNGLEQVKEKNLKKTLRDFLILI